MSAEWPWSELGLEGKADLRAVKRAYAQKLKTIDRDDAKVFQALRDAFANAKARAATDPQRKQPSMREVAAHAQMQPDMPAPTDSGPATSETDDLREALSNNSADPAPATPDTRPTDTPPTDTPPTDPPKKVPAPWGNPQTPEQTEQQKEEAFFNDLRASFDTGIWQLRLLEEVLGRDVMLDRTVRDEAEFILFDQLCTTVVEDSRTIPEGVAKLMEQHFEWATDGVRFNKKFGWRHGSEIVSYDVARGLRRITVKNTAHDKEPTHGKKARIVMGMIMVAGVFAAMVPEGLRTETIIAAPLVAAISFAMNWCLIAILWWVYSIVRDVFRRIPFVNRLSSTLWNKIVARFKAISDLETALHRPGPRSTALYSLAFVATMIMFLSIALLR